MNTSLSSDITKEGYVTEQTSIQMVQWKIRERFGESTKTGGKKFQIKPYGSESRIGWRNSDFECNEKSDGEPVHVDIDKIVTEGNFRTLALLPNKSEKGKVNNKGASRGGDCNISVHRSNWIFKPPEWLGSVPCFWTQNNI